MNKTFLAALGLATALSSANAFAADAVTLQLKWVTQAQFAGYVLDYTGDLYRKTITVTPIAYLRPELRFNGVNALIAQMHQDVAETRALLQSFDGFTALDRALAATTVA